MSTVPKGSNESRIKTLERLIRDVITNQKKGDSVSTPSDSIRIAKRVETESSSESDSEDAPIPAPSAIEGDNSAIDVLFMYPRIVDRSLTLTARSARAQTIAGCLGDPPEVGAVGLVARVNGYWIWIGGVTFGSSSSESSSEDDCFTLGVPMEDIPVLELEWVLGFNSEGCVGRATVADCINSSEESGLDPLTPEEPLDPLSPTMGLLFTLGS